VIGYLRGQMIERNEESITLDVAGVGYEVLCSMNTLASLSDETETQVWIQTHVREDAIMLFGFAGQHEKKMFNSLLKVNGVGPKMAIKILSAASLEHLTNMIEAGDVKSLSGLPKVGKKTAEQLILSLKGKLVLGSDESRTVKKTAAAVTPRFAGVRGDVLSALVNLGFRLQEAEKVVGDLPEDVDLQVGIRQGLQALSTSF